MNTLYRALDTNNNVVYGEEVKRWKDKLYLFGDKVFEVIPDSLSRFTGLLDTTGKRVFEHDVLLINNELWKVQLYQRLGDTVILTSSPSEIENMFVITNLNTKKSAPLNDKVLLHEIHYGVYKSEKVN